MNWCYSELGCACWVAEKFHKVYVTGGSHHALCNGHAHQQDSYCCLNGMRKINVLYMFWSAQHFFYTLQVGCKLAKTQWDSGNFPVMKACPSTLPGMLQQNKAVTYSFICHPEGRKIFKSQCLIYDCALEQPKLVTEGNHVIIIL